MIPSRTLTRVAIPRATTRALPRPPRRFQSTTTSTGTSSATPQPSHLTSGIIGGLASATLLYTIYSFTPSGRTLSKINSAAREADKKYQAAAATLKDKAPSTDEAISRLKQFAYSYVAWIPGGKSYIDTAFGDLDAVREKNGEEVDELVKDAYAKFQDIAKAGLSLEAASRAWDALTELGERVGKLAGSAAGDVLERHPQLKETVGGPMETLKEMGDSYGPEAKKMVDQTWDQVRDVIKSGVSMESVEKIKKIVEEKTQQLKEFGDKAWEKGMEQAKPYLEKNPKVKEMLEKNKDALKKGDATALFKQVKSAVESGDVGKLEGYVNEAVEKAKSSPSAKKASSMVGGGDGAMSGLGQFMGGAGGKVPQHLELLTQVVNNHSAEGKKLLDETKADLTKLLEEKAKKAQRIVDSAQKEKA